MPKTLAHPTASPTTDYPVFGDILTGGGAVPVGKDKLGQPSSGYVFTGALWIPQSATLAGEALVKEYSAAGIWGSVVNLLDEMRENRQTTEGARAALAIMTELGIAAQAYTTMPGIKVGTDGHSAVLSAQRQGISMAHNLGQLAFDCQRKYVGIDAGAYVSPVAVNGVQVTFTGVNLVGRAVLCFNSTDRTYHSIGTVVDPAGGAVGTFQVSPPIPSANAVLRIPYSSTEMAYNTATDAMQTLPIAAPPKGVNGPAVLLSNAAIVDAPAVDIDIAVPVSNYDLFTVWIYWLGAGDDTYEWNVLGRIDDLAAPGDLVNINAWFNVAGTALPGASIAGLSAARITARTQLRELVIRRRKTQVGGVSDAASIRVWIMTGR